ncbi:MAG: hypothetical protein AB7P49_19235, partial [Bdellovibrionales bacterium]
MPKGGLGWNGLHLAMSIVNLLLINLPSLWIGKNSFPNKNLIISLKLALFVKLPACPRPYTFEYIERNYKSLFPHPWVKGNQQIKTNSLFSGI